MIFLKVDKNQQITEWGEVADNEKGDYSEDMILLPEGIPKEIGKEKIFEMKYQNGKITENKEK